ncbi:3BP2-like protein [Mya arenaria]|uniref:3BP2-like protein n=1 Tax=Mya arenaria TaxID=6604 RepID=A0ABY7FSL4_MYAAR|nr:3BP2-like protein [Mya arenaria]
MSDDSNPAKVITEPLKNIGKQRFVVISQGCIYCFKDEYATKPLTAFALCYFQGAADVDIAGVLNSFEVRHEEAGKNPYQFAAETEEKRKTWVGFINAAIGDAREPRQNLSAESDEGICMAPTTPTSRPPLKKRQSAPREPEHRNVITSSRSEYDLESDEEEDDPYDRVPLDSIEEKNSKFPIKGKALPGAVQMLPGLNQLTGNNRPKTTISGRPGMPLPNTPTSYQQTDIRHSTTGQPKFESTDYMLNSKDRHEAASSTPTVLCVVVDSSVKEFQVFEQDNKHVSLNKEKYFPKFDNLLLFYHQNFLPKKDYNVKLKKGYKET